MLSLSALPAVVPKKPQTEHNRDGGIDKESYHRLWHGNRQETVSKEIIGHEKPHKHHAEHFENDQSTQQPTRYRLLSVYRITHQRAYHARRQD